MEKESNVFIYDGGLIPDYHDIEGAMISHIHVNKGVTSIPDGAFQQWVDLISVFVSDGVKTIGDQAFSFNDELTSIRLPNSPLELVGTGIFENCSSLRSIDIPFSMTTIADSTFSGCKSLSKVSMSTLVTRIGVESFASCDSMTSIKLHGAIEYIDNEAFSCTSLYSIQIPPSTISIGDRAFAEQNHKSLMVAYFPHAAIEHANEVFAYEDSSYLWAGKCKGFDSDHDSGDNLILLTDKKGFTYNDYDRGDIPTLTLCEIEQIIHGLSNEKDINHADNDSYGDANDDIPTTTQQHQQLQEQLDVLHESFHRHYPNIAQRAQNSGLNLLHLLLYFPGDIYEPLTELLDKYPLITTAVDNTGRTPFHHAITSTIQNMDSRSYALLASRSPDQVVHLAIQSAIHCLSSYTPWHEVYDIAKAKMNALEIEDEQSGLVPFMMVAEEGDGSLELTAVYELLSMKPDVLNKYI